MDAIIILGVSVIVGAGLGLGILHIAHFMLLRGIGITQALNDTQMQETARQLRL